VAALGTIDGVRGLDGSVQVKRVLWNVGIVAYNLQLAQALGADDPVVAVNEHLGAQVHLFAAFGTGVYHNRLLLLLKSCISSGCCKNDAIALQVAG
jgi:hypothetical protein